MDTYLKRYNELENNIKSEFENLINTLVSCQNKDQEKDFVSLLQKCREEIHVEHRQYLRTNKLYGDK